MIRSVGRTVGLSLLYAAAVEFPLALCFWYVGIPAARPSAPALLLAFSQLPGVLLVDSLQLWQGEAPLVAADDVLRLSLEHAGALALINTGVLALLVYVVLRTAAAFAAGGPEEEMVEGGEAVALLPAGAPVAAAPAVTAPAVAAPATAASARPAEETVAA